MHIPDEALDGPVQAVALIGAALRFPGASDPAAFHDLTAAGRCMLRPLADVPAPTGSTGKNPPARPRSRLAALLDADPRDSGRDGEPTGGVAARHTLAARTAAAALSDIPPAGRAVAPERIGVFIADVPEPGSSDVHDQVRRQLRVFASGGLAVPRPRRRALLDETSLLQPAGTRFHVADSLPRTGTSVAGDGAGRTGNGTALANGSAPTALHCSLRAVVRACEALNAGEYDLVLAGGVATGIGNWPADRTRNAGTGQRLRVYDRSPSGAFPGEGCGIVALVRACDARSLEVPAYAEIAGWHCTDEGADQGADQGLAGQPASLHEVYQRAGVDPVDIQFVEGHGAATAADDHAELSALMALFGPRPDGALSRCALGAVAANIGDTRAAAGIAALLKTAFAMTADVIPPSTGCVRPNRLLNSGGAPFRLPSAPEQWPQTPVQFAAVNTLGTAPSPDAPRSGSVHLVLRRERDLTLRPGRRRKPSAVTRHV